MTAGLETFAKVRALHDRTTNAGEKAAAAGRMEAIAKAAGMTVKQATSKLDKPAKPQPKTSAQSASDMFNGFFNSPEMLAERAEREAKRRVKAAGIIADFGSEEAVFEDTPMEAALRQACAPLLGSGETWNTIYRLSGWDGYGAEKMPASVRKAVTEAWLLPETVAAAWAEYEASERLLSDRCVVEYHYTPHSFTDARRYVVEDLCNTLPARSLNDLRARLSWMEFWANGEISQPPKDHRANLATLRADIERMGVQIRQGGTSAQNPAGLGTGYARSAYPSSPPDPATSKPIQEGVGIQHVPLRRTNADKRRDVLALFGLGLTDREISRRTGVSPQTVGNIRRSSR